MESRTPVYGYLRVSSKGQLDGDGFPRQLAAIRKYTAERDMRIVQVFEERAVPGKTEWAHRPAWTEMLSKIGSNGVKAILIERLDRLARDLMVQELIVADLRKRGIALASTSEPDLGSDDPHRVAMRQMMGVFAQYERSMLVIKLKVARDRKRADTGKCEGRKFFGDMPGESAVRDRIRSMRKTGSTLQAICNVLNAEPVATRFGKVWMPMTVQRIAGR